MPWTQRSLPQPPSELPNRILLVSAGVATLCSTTPGRAESEPLTAGRLRRQRCTRDAFINPATKEPYTFTPDLVTSGVSVGVPGTPATWERALKRWGSFSLADALEPAIEVAEDGFEVDATFPLADRRKQSTFCSFSFNQRDSIFPGGDCTRRGVGLQEP
jgi:hypothetical protein